MPWSKSKPPPNTGKLNDKQLTACISAANSVLSKAGSESAAMKACWAAAGKAGYKPKSKRRGSAETAAELYEDSIGSLQSEIGGSFMDKALSNRVLSALILCEKEVGMEEVYGYTSEEIRALFSETVTSSDGYQYDKPMYRVINVFSDWVLLMGKDKANHSVYFNLPYSTGEKDQIALMWDQIVEVAPVVEYQEKVASLSSFKIAGEWYWAARSASSFKDRDGEIISNKSIDSAIEHADKGEEYGPLRIYHMPGTDVGDTLAMVRVSNFLLEVGKWRKTPMAEAARKWVENNPKSAGVSVGFKHGVADKEQNVYVGDIVIIERSLLDVKDAACPWTNLSNMSWEAVMGKTDKLAAIIGDEMTESLVSQAEKDTEALIASGVAFKEVEAESETPEETPAAEEAEETKESGQEEAAEASEEAEKAEDEQVKELVVVFPPEVMESLKTLSTSMESVEKANKALVEEVKASGDRIGELEKTVAVLLEADEEKIEKRLSELPRATVKGVSVQQKKVEKEETVDSEPPDPDAEEQAQKEIGGAPKSVLQADSLEESIAMNRKAYENR